MCGGGRDEEFAITIVFVMGSDYITRDRYTYPSVQDTLFATGVADDSAQSLKVLH